MFKALLLNKLCTEHPNAYVKIGETYFPTRHELYNFELIRNSINSNLFKYHNELPVILALEESQRLIFGNLYNHLVYDSTIIFNELSLENQIEFILLMKGICTDKELKFIIEKGRHNYHGCIRALFHIDLWVKLMDYMISTDFIEEYQRMEICIFIFSGIKEQQKGDRQSISYRLKDLKESELEVRHPLFYKALKFYNISLHEIRTTSYKYIKCSGSGMSN